MQTRMAREEDRKFLKMAKEWFAERNEMDPSTRSRTHIRGYITKIKKILATGGQPNWADYSKSVKPCKTDKKALK